MLAIGFISLFFLLLIMYALCSADHSVFGTVHIEAYV